MKMTKKGFTIIEVSLVIAIAGLIFLMVFIALPSLRSQQRDTSRRENMISFLDNVKKYQTNNRGALPGASDNDAISKNGSVVVTYNDVKNLPDNSNADTYWKGFYKKYLGQNFIDPSGEHYSLQVLKCNQSVVGSDCNSSVLTNLNNASFPNNYRIVVVIQAACSGEKAIASSNPRKLAILYKLEGAGIYCNNI